MHPLACASVLRWWLLGRRNDGSTRLLVVRELAPNRVLPASRCG